MGIQILLAKVITRLTTWFWILGQLLSPVQLGLSIPTWNLYLTDYSPRRVGVFPTFGTEKRLNQHFYTRHSCQPTNQIAATHLYATRNGLKDQRNLLANKLFH